jgi:hypothetical protein
MKPSTTALTVVASMPVLLEISFTISAFVMIVKLLKGLQRYTKYQNIKPPEVNIEYSSNVVCKNNAKYLVVSKIRFTFA